MQDKITQNLCFLDLQIFSSCELMNMKNQYCEELLSALHCSQLAFGPFFQGGKMHGIQSELSLPRFTKVRTEMKRSVCQ